MSKRFIKGNAIAISIWIFFLVFQLIEKYSINQIIYVQAEMLTIVIFIDWYILGLKKYRSIPERTVTANFIKECISVNNTVTGEDRPDLDRGRKGYINMN